MGFWARFTSLSLSNGPALYKEKIGLVNMIYLDNKHGNVTICMQYM